MSIDGLRADHVTPELMPELSAFLQRSAYTLNARSDPDFTWTLPVHTSQFTGRPALGPAGHGIQYNEDLGATVHEEAGEYVPSVFDVVHDNGGGTLMFVGKSKFSMHDRSWNATYGAPDITGVDNGRDKIDVYVKNAPDQLVQPFLDELDSLEFGFFHIRTPDEFGHIHAWDTAGYRTAVTEADATFGQLLAGIDANPAWATTTAIIVVSDHGGVTDEFSHRDPLLPSNYTVPMVVFAPGVDAGADLYDLNPSRIDPGTSRPGLDGPQPLRVHEVANLALDLLGYDALTGSTFNAAQDLRIG